MLIHLQIRNFAIIDNLEMDFTAGMCAITGETGAGKSIAVDALSLLLGDRADSSVVRHGAEQAELCAEFDLSALPEAQHWLQTHDLAINQPCECQLRRVITQQSRSRNYINGSLQPLAMLRELSQWLADIHSQHEHQSLLRRDTQRQLLDNFGGHNTLANEVNTRYQVWQQLAKRLNSLSQDAAEREAKLDLLRYQVQELVEFGLAEDEASQLEEEYKRLSHSGQLLEVTQSALNELYDHEQQALQTRLSRQVSALENLLDLDPSLRPIAELLGNALVHIEEASFELRDYCNNIEQDPERLHWLNERMTSLQRLARKHQCTPDQLPEQLVNMQQELTQLESDDWDREALSQKLAQAEADYHAKAKQLSTQRAKTAVSLGQQITVSMQQLGMQGGQFAIDLKPAQAAAFGLERIEFQVSANPGQPLRPLAKVASGGELSRISLAIQVIAANFTTIPTLIFDEVDTGIGGAVAETVGRLLRQLGDQRQIICVTHLPQVAVQAHEHLQVSKAAKNRQTHTLVQRLNEQQRVEELARMLGGRQLTDKTLAHAREMMHQAIL